MLNFFKDKQLLTSLIKFRFVKLNIESIGSILIDRESQDLDITKTHKDEVRISVAHKDIPKIIQEIKSSLILLNKKHPRNKEYKKNWIYTMGK